MATEKSVPSVDEELQDTEEENKRALAAAREANRLPEIRLVLLGWRWPGKSLTGNTILGREEFRLERAAEFSVMRQTEVTGRQVAVVDTPGWFSSQATPPAYRQEMMRAVTLCPPGPHAFLLVIPVGMFTESDRAKVEEHLGMFGERVWRHTIVVFTWAPGLREMPIERHIRREGRDLQWVVERCKNRYHVINNQIFGEHPQLPRLLEKVEDLVAEEGGFFTADTVTEDREEDGKPHANHSGGRELGARPKQNGNAVSFSSVGADPLQKTGSGEASQATSN